MGRLQRNFKTTIVIMGMMCSFAVVYSQEEGGSYRLDLGELVVTASKREQLNKYTSQNISIITEEDIIASGAHEITDILDLLPSVDVLSYGSAGALRSIHTRGADSMQVLTLIDGHAVNTPRDGLTDFNQVPLSNIKRIEVLRGPASNMYGANAVGGVINIITKTGKEIPETNLLLGGGSFATKFVSLGHGNKKNNVDYFMTYDYTGSHGHRDNSEYLANNITTKLGYDFDEENRLEISGGYYNAEVGAPGPLSGFGAPDLDDMQETFTKYVDVTYRGSFFADQEVMLKTFVNSDRLEFIETPDPIAKDNHQTKIYGAEFQSSHVFFEVLRTSFGSSLQKHTLNSSTSAKYSYRAKAFYVDSETDLFGKGIFKAGVRWDDFSNFGDRVSPSASCNFWVFDLFKLHALAAKAFRVPTFNDLYWPASAWTEGNPNLGPEKAKSYEVGVSGYFFDRFKTDVTVFKNDYRELINWTPDAFFVWKPANVDSAEIKGVEVESEFVVKEHLKANINYTFLKTEDKNVGKWLIYRPRHMYKCRVTYSPVSQCVTGINFIYVTKRFADSANMRKLKHYGTVDLTFHYTLKENIQLWCDVKNIFDVAFQEVENYSVPGRAIYAGTKLSF